VTSSNGGSGAAAQPLEVVEVARRVRAARAYAQLTVGELADRIGLGAQTIKRIEAARRNPRLHEVWAIAEACGLPRAFFELQFSGLIDRAELVVGVLSDIDARLRRLEQRLGQTRRAAQTPKPRTR
jgi:transcriptional regulator with XRE-family HTH domain